MKVTHSNYFSKKVRSRYMSASTFKNIVGTTVEAKGCPAKEIAKRNGWEPEFKKDQTALLVGSYVDAYFEGTIDEFIYNNQGIISSKGATKGQLKTEFQHALKIIKYIERDNLFMSAMSGEKQKIVQGSIDGIDYIGKLDVCFDSQIVDLKVMKDMSSQYIEGIGKVNFIKAWGYDIQLAIYQELEYQMTGVRKECMIACCTKQKPPQKAIISIPQDVLDEALGYVKFQSDVIREFISGKYTERCEKCDYCLETKNIDRITSYYEM